MLRLLGMLAPYLNLRDMENGLLSDVREVMTLEEAADFLRLSRSTLYQRTDIPRHRLPGSRQLRFLRSELLLWMKGGQAEGASAEGAGLTALPVVTAEVIDIAARPIYHRNTRYR